MKRLLSVLMMSAFAVALSACTSTADQYASECRQHGFVMGSTAFTQCMNLLEDHDE